MIGHEAVGQDAHGDTIGRGSQQREKGGIILGFVKDLGASIAPINDVGAKAPNRGPSGAWSDRYLPNAAGVIHRKVECPLFLIPDTLSNSLPTVFLERGRLSFSCGVHFSSAEP